MCKREKPLSLTEGMSLGMETVLRLADARERARQQAAESGIRSPTFDDFEDVQMEDMIREVFGIPPRPMSPGRHSRNSSGVVNGFGGTAIPNGFGFPAQTANGETTSGLNGAGSASQKPFETSYKPSDTLHVSTEPISTNGSTKADGKKPKDGKPLSPAPNGAPSQQAGSGAADNKGGAEGKTGACE